MNTTLLRKTLLALFSASLALSAPYVLAAQNAMPKADMNAGMKKDEMKKEGMDKPMMDKKEMKKDDMDKDMKKDSMKPAPMDKPVMDKKDKM